MSTPPNHDLIYQAVREVSFDLAVAGIELDRPLTTRVKPGFNTAAWTFNRDQHTIFMGDAVFPWDRAKPLADADKLDVYKSLYRHELAHAAHTTRDFASMNAMCRRAKCEFQLLNIFEDARIEHLEREASGQQFGWANFMAAPPSGDSPTSIFFTMIEQETRDVVASDSALLERVQSYYDRVIAAPDTEALEPLLKEWTQEFKRDQDQQKDQGQQGQGEGQPGQGQGQQPDQSQDGQQQQQQGQGGTPSPGQEQTVQQPGQEAGKGEPAGKSDSLTADRDELPMSAQLSNDVNYDQFSADTVDVKDLGPQQQKDHSRGDGGDGRVKEQDESLEWGESKKLAAVLKKAMQGVNRSVASDVPSKKLNVKGMTRPGAPMFRRKELQGQKRLNLFFVVDISGSMDGEPIKNGRLLAGALHVLAEQGLAEGKILLSGSSYRDMFDLKDRDAREKIEAIGAIGGGEGFTKNFIDHRKDMEGRDAVLVFTDANTEKVDRDMLAKHKVYPIGLYCGTDKKAPDNLRENFDRNVVRDSIDELTFALVSEFGRAAKSQGRGTSSAARTLSKLAEGLNGEAIRISQGRVQVGGVDATDAVRELAGLAPDAQVRAADVKQALKTAVQVEKDSPRGR